ncbi:sigma 54-interacting transcriptional regulator [Clostridium sp. PL3]|uniref:HTH-type transcriptional regulatory protein TyrR n=1 Tax=Clostridium thailandense TaxID=2794346 RepID=A0A949TIN1_9CLOT|nr:sigma 54-interacting transcriptional regulator [Clostridium thailandense]MBV7272970.1 sigma 54-interacting transcriptional regulator [Clostridium thailandense]
MLKKEVLDSIKNRISNIFSIIEKNSDNNNLKKIETNIRSELSKILTSLEIFDELIDENLDFKEIVENLDESVFITDGEGKVLYVNPSYEINTGIKPEEVLNYYVEDILEEGKLFKGGVTLEVIKKRTKATRLCTTYKTIPERVGYVNGVPVFDSEGNIKLIIASSRTILSFNSLQEDYGNFLQEIKSTRDPANIRILPTTEDEGIKKRMIGESRTMGNLWSIIEKVANTDATVLITGESGVGKELVSDEIYKRSKRKNMPFIKINCSSIPSNLLESELFGYEKGAFSGANVNGKPGLFELANKGTLLLDEIGEMPLELQAKLLRAIQNREIMRIGATKPINLDIRIIASTNVNLKKSMEDGKFRSDLYYRLSVVPIQIPPLRERIDDIPELCNHFLNSFINKHNRQVTLSDENINLMKMYNWPGNIRELENVIEYLVICCSDNAVVDNNVLVNLLNFASFDAESFSGGFGLKEAVESYEKKIIQKAVNSTKSLREASILLNIDASTISRKVKHYNI